MGLDLLDELSLKEKEAIDELKRRTAADVNEDMRDDTFLYLRFLRARDFNINLAESMLKNHLAWRKANNIDNIIAEYGPDESYVHFEKTAVSKHKRKMSSFQRNSRIEIVRKYFPFTTIGFDPEGAVIRFIDFGTTDTKGILRCVSKTDVVTSIVTSFETDIELMKEQSKKLGKPVQQWVYILNFEGYSFAKATHKATLETLLSLFMQYEANYPERLKAAYVINASVYFTILFSVIKPLLSGATLRKIKIFGKGGWNEVLLKEIGPDVLPAFLGGNLTDPDGNPLCRTMVKHGCPVPEDLYITRNTNRLCGKPGVKKLTVARMSKIHVVLEVNEPGSLIEWEFETECRDISFGLLYKANHSDECALKELIPKQRIDTNLTSEVGMYACDRTGTYILLFDNSYSWLHQKEIYCKAVVVTPKGQEVTVLDP